MSPFGTDAADDRVRAALDAVADGRAVVVGGDASTDGEGDLVFAAERATPALVAFTVRHTSGFVCVALPGDDCARLDLPPMRKGDRSGTDYRTTVDAHGTGSGISATARATTIAALGSPASRAADFTRPGHVVPLRADARGVLGRRGRTDAAVDLARLAGLPPAAAVCGIVSTERPAAMARGDELRRFADVHALPFVSVDDLARHRLRTERFVCRTDTTAVATEFGDFCAVGYADGHTGAGHVALVAGPDGAVSGDTPVHVHVECVSGVALRARHCRCARSLHEAMARFSAGGCGVVVYLRSGPGLTGCGLSGCPAPGDPWPTVVADAIVRDLHDRSGSLRSPGAGEPVAARGA